MINKLIKKYNPITGIISNIEIYSNDDFGFKINDEEEWRFQKLNNNIPPKLGEQCFIFEKDKKKFGFATENIIYELEE